MTDTLSKKISSSVLPLFPAALVLFLLPACLASGFTIVRRLPALSAIPAATVYCMAVALLARWIARRPAALETRTALFLVLGSAVAKAILILLFPRLPHNSDQALFHHFAQTLATGGLSVESLSTLNGFYDYHLWSGRAFPFHYLLARIFGQADLVAVRWVNLLVSSLLLGLVYDLSRSVLPAGRRVWPLFFLAVLPFQSLWVTDYSHHLFSTTYLLAFEWCLWKGTTNLRPLFRFLSIALSIAFLLLMTWQGGVNLLAVASMPFWMFCIPARHFRLGFAFLHIIIPVVAVLLLAGPLFGNRRDAADAHLDTTLPAYAARGWSTAKGGEYDAQIEKLVLATPVEDKTTTMFRAIASQAAYHPARTCLFLPAVKTAKLFSLGAANNFEESLHSLDFPALPAVQLVRRTGTCLFLALTLLGLFALLRSPSPLLPWLPFFVLPILTWGAYVLAGETSPRYSVFCQPFLAILAAAAIPGTVRRDTGSAALRTKVLRPTAIATAMLFCFFAFLSLLAANLPRCRLFLDLAEGWDNPDGLDLPHHPPFVAKFAIPNFQPTRWTPAAEGDSPQPLCFYLLGMDSSAPRADLVVGDAENPLRGPLARVSPDTLLPVRLVLPPVSALAFSLVSSDGSLVAGEAEIGFAFRPCPAGEPAPASGSIPVANPGIACVKAE